MLNNLQQMRLSSSNRVTQKTVKATRDVIGNKIADKTKRASETSRKKNLEKNEDEILREKYISPTLRQKIMDDLRLKEGSF